MNNINKVTTALAHAIAERKEAETKEKALKLELQSLLTAAGKDKEETDQGVFTIARRSYWSYPEDVVDQIDEMKAGITELQEEAQHNGLATENVTEYVLFKEAK